MATSMTDLGLRERKKERTRAAIEEAALELFDRKGLEATTVDEIAAAADVSPRTFFRYFAAKEDVVFCHDDDGDWLLTLLQERAPGDSALDVLRSAFLALATDFEANRERHLRRFRLSRSSPGLHLRLAERRRRHEELLVEGLSDDTTDMLELRVEVASAFAALRVCIDDWLEQGGTSHLPSLALGVLDRLGRGFERPAV